jgi:hypothetical protein
MPRGAYAPALVLQCACLPVKNNFFDAQTHTHKSGQQVVGGEGGEPMAPIVATPLEPVSQGPDAWAIAFTSVFPPVFRPTQSFRRCSGEIGKALPHAAFPSANSFGAGSSSLQ